MDALDDKLSKINIDEENIENSSDEEDEKVLDSSSSDDSSSEEKEAPIKKEFNKGSESVGRRKPRKNVAIDRKLKTHIPKSAFRRLVREIASDFHPNMKFRREAMEALQEVSEDYLITCFLHAQKCAEHANRETLFPADMRLVRNLRKYTPMDFEKLG
jgi:histone H3/H4